MKVTDAKQIGALAAGKPQQPARPRAGGPEGRDRVSTDDSNRVASAVEQASQGAGAARAAKLQDIEAAVRDGTYRPDPQRIAQQILDDAELAARLQALFQT